jgi:hypothetical protein
LYASSDQRKSSRKSGALKLRKYLIDVWYAEALFAATDRYE